MAELTKKVEHIIWDKATEQVWKERMAQCFKNRQRLGQIDMALRTDIARPTPSIVSCFEDYERICTAIYSRGGGTFILYGPFGSGKSQTVLTLLRGSSHRNPDRGIMVNLAGGSESGNALIRRLCTLLNFEGGYRALGSLLVEIATSQTLGTRAAGYCCTSQEEIELENDIKIIPFNEKPTQFDKMPMILLDSVDFILVECEEITN
jgi:hypothetical protein